MTDRGQTAHPNQGQPAAPETASEPHLAAPSAGPSYAATITAPAIAQTLNWAALYYTFSSFVLPMQHELGWDKATLMGAFTLGLAVWGAAALLAFWWARPAGD